MTEVSLFKDYHTLFSKFFIENCKLDEAEITEEESKALQDLDSNEVFENFSDLVNQLLKFKRQYLQTESAELIKKCDSFEALIQKLESEVRTHIGVEHQLKLIIENFKSKLQILEKTNHALSLKISEQKNLLRRQKVSLSIEREDPDRKFKDKVKSLHMRTKSDLLDLKKLSKNLKIDAITVRNKALIKKPKALIQEKNKAKTLRGKHMRSSSDLLFRAKYNNNV